MRVVSSFDVFILFLRLQYVGEWNEFIKGFLL